MKIYLMRHGETEYNRVGRLQGQSDIPLNEFGIQLAEKTAEGLKSVSFDAVFSSPLQRALETARIAEKIVNRVSFVLLGLVETGALPSAEVNLLQALIRLHFHIPAAAYNPGRLQRPL